VENGSSDTTAPDPGAVAIDEAEIERLEALYHDAVKE
jgi:hypothetical protein